MARKGGDITDDDALLWDMVMADVKPLKGIRARKTTPAPAPKKPAIRERVSAPPSPSAPMHRGRLAKDIDRSTREKLERGQMKIDAVLDLHGKGQDVARETLVSFLRRAWRNSNRCVLVITGKGKDGQGVLRARLPEWLEEAPLDDIVLRATPAKPKDGGLGAFYVLLRRQRL